MGADHANALIEGNLRIAAAIASRYASFMPWLKEDCFCEAALALAKAISNLPQCNFKDPGGLRGYVRKTIHGHVGDFISRNISGFNISGKQYWRIKNGKSTKKLDDLQKVVIGDPTKEHAENIFTNLPFEEAREHLIDRLERLMKDAGLDAVEYQVLMLHVTGHNLREIATQLQIHTSTVDYKRIEAIEKLKYIFFSPDVDSDSIN
jgi:RNA polymerase sigma factor (sigma-70 family)